MIGEVVAAERWTAARALSEGAAPTQARLAAVMGISQTTLAKKAGEEEWVGLDFRMRVTRDAHTHMVEVARRAKAGQPVRRIDYGRFMDDGSVRLTSEADTQAMFGDVVPADVASDAAQAKGPADLLSTQELSDLPPAERTARVRLMLTRRIEAVLARAEAGGQVEAKHVAAIGALAQLADRIAPAALDPETVRRENAIERDRRVAAALERVNARILYLSKAFAVDVLVEGGMAREEAEAKVAALP